MRRWLSRLFRGDAEPIAQIHLNNGDALVVRVSFPMSAGACEKLRHALENKLPGASIIILPPGVELSGVVRAPGPFVPQPRAVKI